MSDTFILGGADGHTPVPCDYLVWARWLEGNGASRVVARTGFAAARVSTVFLGLNHSYGDGPPLLFETLVFDGPLDGEMDRYSTWAEAEAGHEAMCVRVRAGPDA